MDDTVLVIVPGRHVLLTGSIKAVVLSVKIGPELAVSYECGWWVGNEYRTAEFLPMQVIQNHLADERRIGFT